MRPSLLLVPFVLAECALAPRGAVSEASSPLGSASGAEGGEACAIFVYNQMGYPAEVRLTSSATRVGTLGVLEPGQGVSYALPCVDGGVSVSAVTTVRKAKIRRGRDHFATSAKLVQGETVRIALRP